MLDLTVAVPVPLALFILTLTLDVIGFLKSKKKDLRMLWLAIGFCEVLLAFICFVGFPALFYPDWILTSVVPIVFSFISLIAVLGASTFILKEQA